MQIEARTLITAQLQYHYQCVVAGVVPNIPEPEGPFIGEEEQAWYDLLVSARQLGGGGVSSANRLTVTNAGFQNQQQVNDALLYVPLQVSYLGTGLGVQRKGSTLAAVTLGWGYNKVVTSQTVAGQSLAIGVRVLTLPAVNLTATTSYALAATDGQTPVGAGATVYFSNDRFWFVGTAGLNIPAAGAVTDRPAVETRAIQFTLTAGAGQKIYYMRPERLGAGTYVVGGFEGGFIERIVTYTNATGYTENYIIGESTNTALGLTTVTIN